jgi:hypothetical protein
MKRKNLGLGAKGGIFVLVLTFSVLPVSPSFSGDGETSTNTVIDDREKIVAAADTESPKNKTAAGNAGEGGTQGLSPAAVGGITLGILGLIGLASFALSGGGGGGSSTTADHPGQ